MAGAGAGRGRLQTAPPPPPLTEGLAGVYGLGAAHECARALGARVRKGRTKTGAGQRGFGRGTSACRRGGGVHGKKAKKAGLGWGGKSGAG